MLFFHEEDEGKPRLYISLFLNLRNCFLQLPIYIIKMFRYNLDIRNYGHKIGIAVPAWHNMKVDVIGEARARNLPLVDAHVKAVGIHRQAQRFERELNMSGEIGKRGGIEAFKRSDMLIGNYHQVPVIVRVQVQHHEAVFATVENVMLFIAMFRRLRAENAPWRWRRFRSNESHAPRCPQILHRSPSKKCSA